MAQIFPKWSNDVPGLALFGLVVAGGGAVAAMWYWMSPQHTEVGYAPKQPIAYSHRLHAGDLGMDCRYCHAIVERSPHAGVPPTQTCMNCHSQVKKDSPLLEPLRQSWTNGTPVAWKRIHKEPDFVYFDHSAHVAVGVGENRAAIGCESCHGRIDTMEVVRQEKPLSMSWCLDCHNAPAQHLRPTEKVTAMGWSPTPEWRDKAERIATTLHPPGNHSGALVALADGTTETRATAGCSGCHR